MLVVVSILILKFKFFLLTDVTNPNNPFPFYNQITSFDKPTLTVEGAEGLEVVAIDHLPTLIPKESSEDFSNDLIAHLKHLKNVDFKNENPSEEDQVWTKARDLFHKKVEEWKQQ